ncbi:MAG: hypothetical protein ABIA12_01350 [Candidatus Aenigmatarchaeota archaeon]
MTVISELWKKGEVGVAKEGMPFPPSDSGFVAESEVYHVSPRSVSSNDINFTSFPGKCSATLFSLMFWFGKLGYRVVKAEDSMEISPMHTQYYQITIQQKQTLERQIKEGLAGITQAITDFELLFHDLRKYKDFLNYFNAKDAAKKAKDDAAIEKANQSLKAVFIDQVDVHTGERVALRNIAGRWPTIISDFMRLKDSDSDPRKIAKDYGVSEAEGVVLATKNKLFGEWADTFGRVVKDRYDRLLGMVKARKFSIDEYKTMLKPYIERYKSIHEVGPGTSPTSKALSWLRPGAQASSIDTARIWAFKPMTRPEPTRITYENYGGKENILKAKFCPSFAAIIRKNIGKLKEAKLDELPLSPCGIEPLDKWVWALYKYIEDEYEVNFSLEELLKFRNEFVGIKEWGGSPEPYFKCFDAEVVRVIIRLPDGTELEDMTFNPLHFYLESHNMMFLRFLEIKAQDKRLEKYINDMLGDTTTGKKLSELTAEYEKLFKVFPAEEKVEKEKADNDLILDIKSGDDMHAAREKAQKQVELECREVNSTLRFFNRGPYEARFDDIITGPYFNDVGSSMGKVQTFLKSKFDVPGFSSPGVAG